MRSDKPTPYIVSPPTIPESNWALRNVIHNLLIKVKTSAGPTYMPGDGEHAFVTTCTLYVETAGRGPFAVLQAP